MSEADEKRKRIREKVSASQERLKRESGAKAAAPSPARFPDAYPPEDYRSLAREYPLLTVAAGIGAGLLLGAILPKGVGGKFGRRALAAATVAAELGLTLSKQAGEKAAGAGREGLSKAGEGASELRGKVIQLTTPARATARSAGLVIAREAIKLAARARK